MKPVWTLFVVPVATLLVSVVYGDSISTTTGGNWSAASTWTPPTVPNNASGTGYDVTIGPGVNAPVTVFLDMSPTINSLTLNSLLYATPGVNPVLSIVNGMNSYGPLIFGGDNGVPEAGPGSLSVGRDLNIFSTYPYGFYVDGSLNVGGNLTVSSNTFNSLSEVVLLSTNSNNAPERFSVAGTLTNQATGEIFLGYGRCANVTSASCPEEGPVSNLAGGPNTTVGALVNNGRIYSWSNITAATLSNNGIMAQVGGSASIGTLKNSGTLYLSNEASSFEVFLSSAVNVGGVGTPGAVGYNQFTNGVLDEMLLGKSSYGKIFAGPWPDARTGVPTGYPVNLNGTLDIVFGNGFIPSFGDAFTIITTAPGDISGTFSNVVWDSFDNGKGYFSVSYDNAAGDVIITAEPVPEPRTLLLVVPVLCVVLWRARSGRHVDR